MKKNPLHKLSPSPLLAATLAACTLLLLKNPLLALPQELFSAQLVDGTVVKGEVLSWDNEDLSLKSTLGTLIINKEKLTPKTAGDLKKFAYNPAAATREQLVAKVAELEEALGSLRRDNAALREQLGGGSPSSDSGAQDGKGSPKGGKQYWISKSGKRHNENCRYYKTGTGKEGTSKEGEPCKVCGG